MVRIHGDLATYLGIILDADRRENNFHISKNQEEIILLP